MKRVLTPAVYEMQRQSDREMHIDADDGKMGGAADVTMAASDVDPVDAPTAMKLDADMGVYMEDTEQLLKEAEELLRATEEIEEV